MASKALAAGERRGAAQVERAIGQAEGRAAAASRLGAKGVDWKGLRKEAVDIVKEGGSDLAMDWVMDKSREIGRRQDDFSRFPNPAAVVPLASARPEYDSQLGLYGQPNNFGGMSFFNMDGTPAGFTALHKPSNRLHLFDPFGNRVR